MTLRSSIQIPDPLTHQPADAGMHERPQARDVPNPKHNPNLELTVHALTSSLMGGVTSGARRARFWPARARPASQSRSCAGTRRGRPCASSPRPCTGTRVLAAQVRAHRVRQLVLCARASHSLRTSQQVSRPVSTGWTIMAHDCTCLSDTGMQVI